MASNTGLFSDEQSIRRQLGIDPMDEVEAGYDFDRKVEGTTTADLIPTALSIVAMHPALTATKLVGTVLAKTAPYLTKVFKNEDTARLAVQSALGAGVGRGVQQGVTDDLSLTGTPTAIIKEVGESLMFDKAGGIIGEYGGKLISLSASKVKDMFGKGASELEEVDLLRAAQEMMLKHDASLTPYSVTGRGGVGEAVARGSLTTRGGMVDADISRMEAVKTELANTFSTKMSSQEFGLAFKEIYKNTDEVVKTFFDKAYKEIDVLAQGVVIPTKALKTKYTKLLLDRKKLGVSEDMLNTLKSQFVGVSGKGLTFAEAKTRSSLLKADLRAEKKKQNPNSSVIDLYKKGIADIEGLMEGAAKNQSPELYKKYRSVSLQYKQATDDLNNDVIQNALLGNASQVAETIFKEGNVEEIQSLYKVLGNIATKYNKAEAGNVKKLITEFQNGFIKGAFENVRVANTLAEKQGALQKIIKSFDKEKFGRTYAEVFKGEPNRQRHLQVILKASERALDKPQGILTLLLSGKQSAAITSGLADGVGSVLLILPSLILRSVNDPRHVNRLLKLDTEASKVGGVTPQILSKFMQFAEDLDVTTPEAVEGEESKKAVGDLVTLDSIM